MKLEEVFHQSREKKVLTKIEEEVYQYILEHPDEVFSYTSEEIADALSISPRTVCWTLWNLKKKGKLESYKLKSMSRKWGVSVTFFGLPEAIEKLKKMDEERLKEIKAKKKQR